VLTRVELVEPRARASSGFSRLHVGVVCTLVLLGLLLPPWPSCAETLDFGMTVGGQDRCNTAPVVSASLRVLAGAWLAVSRSIGLDLH